MILVKLALFKNRAFKQQQDIGNFRRKRISLNCSKSLASTKSEAASFASVASFVVKSNQGDELSSLVLLKRLELPMKMRLT